MTHHSRFALALVYFCTALGGVTAAAQTGAPEVSLSGSVAARIVREGESFQFTLTIKNKADAKTNPTALVRDLALQALPDGYSLNTAKPVCVLPQVNPSTESCRAGRDFEKDRVIVAALAPGQSITVQGYLIPSSDSQHRSAPIAVVVAWITGDKDFASSQSASLGEVQVVGIWQGFAAALIEFLKLLAIPAILALIGYWLNDQNRKRDNAFAAASRARDEAFAIAQMDRQNAQHEHEQDQALRSETWKQMLPLSHNYAAKFYLPLSLAAQNLAKQLTNPVAKPRLAFFYLLLCCKQMRATRNEIGGFYFKDLRGECLAANCWEIQRGSCLGEADADFYKSVQAAIDRFTDEIDSFEAFESNFVDTSVNPPIYVDDSVDQAWQSFEKWISGDKASVQKTSQYLTGFYAVLDYESNRPYEYWYDQSVSSATLVISGETQKILEKILEEAKYKPNHVSGYFSAVVPAD
jgi:hypothetical protein